MKLIYLTLFLAFGNVYGQINTSPVRENLVNNIIDDTDESTIINLPKVQLIYPNPLTTETTIQLTNLNDPIDLVILDIYQRTVRNINTNLETVRLDTSDLEKGIYRIVLITNRGIFPQDQKLVVK